MKTSLIRHDALYRLTCAALLLAVALLLPFLTGQIPKIGNMLCPMHLPVFLCGFLCGPIYGLVIGLTAPFLRCLCFGAPLLYPAAIAMAFELAVYGSMAGLLYRLLPKKVYSLYLSLLIPMVLGRLVWGLMRLILAGLKGGSFPFAAFLSGAVTTAFPGIIIQILLIPLIVLALDRAHLIPDRKS